METHTGVSAPHTVADRASKIMLQGPGPLLFVTEIPNRKPPHDQRSLHMKSTDFRWY